MITLTAPSGKKVLFNPAHIILVKEASNTFGESYVEIYHSASKAALPVKEDLNDVHSMLHQFFKN